MRLWPDPLTPHSSKKELEELGRQCLDYARWHWYQNHYKRATHFRILRNSYNGRVDERVLSYINKEYGKSLRSRYVDYRITRNKVDTICGEFLQRPLNSYVYITNKDFILKKVQQKNYLTGLMVAKDEVNRLRNIGFNVADGMDVPESEEQIDKIISMSGARLETIINKSVDDQKNNFQLKTKLMKCLKHICITSECGARIYISENGLLSIDVVQPENMIYLEVLDDDFCKKSPCVGQRMLWTKNQIYQAFDLTPTEKDEIEIAFGRGPNEEYGIVLQGSEICMEVFHIEFALLDPAYKKTVVDPETGERFVYRLSSDYYNQNKKAIDRDIRKKRYEVETRYKETAYEGYVISRLNIYKKIQVVPNQIIKNDDPYPCHFTYSFLLFNTENGVRMSFYECLEEAKHLYNMVRFQINRELYKIKGNVITYDRAYMPRDKQGNVMNMNTVLSKMINDGVYDYNSAGDGNYARKTIDVSNVIKVLDLGASSSLGTLINMAYNIETLIDRIGAVNDNRQGQASASETVTNNQTNIALSRTMTEPMMYFFDRFIEDVIVRIAENSSIAWSLNPDYGIRVLGSDLLTDVKELLQLRWHDFTAKVIDVRNEEQLRQKLNMYLDRAVSAGEVPAMTAMKAEMKDTIAEVQMELEKGWETLQKLKQQEEQRKMEHEKELNQQNIDAQNQVREDAQQHDLDMIDRKGQWDTSKQRQKSADKASLDFTKSKLTPQPHG